MVAVENGSRHAIACDDAGIDVKTFKRWKMSSEDKRKGSHLAPANKLTKEEVEEVIRVSTSAEYVDLYPSRNNFQVGPSRPVKKVLSLKDERISNTNTERRTA